MNAKIFEYNQEFALESGVQLDDLKIAYHTYGQLNDDKSNVVWVFHALSANSAVLEWWPGLFGDYDLFTPKEHFIICANVLGSPYGSTAPESLSFPQFTVRDVVKAQLLLAEELNIEKISLAIGGSFGGSQALEFAYSYTGSIDNMVLIACAARETAWGIAIHEAQRMALQADQTFGEKDGGKKGIKAARALGVLTYRTVDALVSQQTDEDDRVDDFKASSYIQYQGTKFERRFNALSYFYLSKCLDTHNLGRSRGGDEDALSSIATRTLVIGIDSDQLIPNYLQKFIASNMLNAHYKKIASDYGHDGFLIETEKITAVIKNFIDENHVKSINVFELKEIQENNENIQLIDVREAFELEISSIGGLHIPISDIPNQLNKIAADKKVVVYCRSGRRSALAIKHLQEVTGNKNLYNLEGGILDWADKIDNNMELY